MANNNGLLELQRQFELMASPEVQHKFYLGCTKEVASRFLRKVRFKTQPSETLEVEEATGEFYKRGKNKGKAKTKKVVKRLGGTLRRGWTAKTYEEALSGNTPDVPTYVNTRLDMQHNNSNYVAVITNPVPYASFVESGHRQQKGRYVPAIGKRLKETWVEGRWWLAESETEVKAEIPSVLQRRLDDFLRRGGL
jgi:hypothetical protein